MTSVERTLALIKPDVCNKPKYVTRSVPPPEGAEEGTLPTEETVKVCDDQADEIIKQIKGKGFKIVQQKRMVLTTAQAREFYAEQRGQPGFGAKTDFLSSGSICALVLEKAGAIGEWQAAMGDDIPAEALKRDKEAKKPKGDWTLRSLYGSEADAMCNAMHGSDSVYTALREIKFFFPENLRLQRTVALIKPEMIEQRKEKDIVAAIEAKGFMVVGRSETKISLPVAKRLSNSDNGAEHLASGPVVALALERMNAVVEWQLALGPEMVEDAEKRAPASLRAKFGTSKDVRNALYGSATAARAEQDLSTFFTKPFAAEQTLALIKPGTADENGGLITAAIEANGFSIVARKRLLLSAERAQQFYAEHKGKSFFGQLSGYMCSGPMEALVLSKPGAIRAWRTLIGPTNTFKAQTDAPSSLRALYGIDGTQNACHGSDSPESAAREIDFFFPGQTRPTMISSAPSKYIQAKRALPVDTKPLPKDPTLHTVLVKGLAELCKNDAPMKDQVAAVKWLGEWLLANNPRAPTVTDPSDDYMAPPPAPPSSGVVHLRSMPNQGATVAPVAKFQPVIMFVLGGSKNSALCTKMADELAYTHVSMSALLKAEAQSGSALGKKIGHGKKLNDSETIALLKTALVMGKSKPRFLVDGYPRTKSQSIRFEATFGRCNLVVDTTDDGGQQPSTDDENAAKILGAINSEEVSEYYQKLGLLRKVKYDGAGSGQPPGDQAGEEELEAWTVATAELTRVYKSSVLPFVKPNIVFAITGPGGAAHDAKCAALGANAGREHVALQDALQRHCGRDATAAEVAMAYKKLTAQELGRVMLLELQRRSSNNFVVTGFPNTLEQALAFEGIVGSPDMALYFDSNRENKVAAINAAHASTAAGRKNPLDAKAVLSKILTFERAVKPILELYGLSGMLHTMKPDAPEDPKTAEFEAWSKVGELFLPRVHFALIDPMAADEAKVLNGKIHSYLRSRGADDGYVCLTVPDLLRAQATQNTADGRKLRELIKAKQTVPPDMIVEAIQKYMQTSTASRYILADFPRSLEQASLFETAVGPCAKLLHYSSGEGLAEEQQQVYNKYAKMARVTDLTADSGQESFSRELERELTDDMVVVLEAPTKASKPVGKAVCSDKICSQYGYTKLDISQLLRSAVLRGSLEGEELQGIMQRGQLIPIEMSISLVKQAMSASRGRRFLFDGFPRAADQVQVFRDALGKCSMVMSYETPEEADKALRAAKMKAAAVRKAKAKLAAQQSGGEEEPPAEEEEEAPAAEVVEEVDADAVLKADVVTKYKTSMGVAPDAFAAQVLEVKQVAESISSKKWVADWGAIRAHFMPRLITIVGGAGSGAEIASTVIGQKFGYEVLAISQLWDAAVAVGGNAGQAISTARAAGKAISADISVGLLKAAISAAQARGSSKFVLEGFPQIDCDGQAFVHDQYLLLEREVAPVQLCVHMDSPVEERKKACVEAGMDALDFDDAEHLHSKQFSPVLGFFNKIGKIEVLESTGMTYAKFKDEVAPNLTVLPK
jgi:nucleoside diphosphate kinase/adenylate kinase family enzyme